LVLEGDEAGHGVGAGAVHADLAVVIDAHEAEGHVDGGIYNGEIEFVAFSNGVEDVNAGAAEGVGPDAETGGADDFHVDDGGEVFDVGMEEILAVGCGGGEGALEGDSFYAFVVFAEECIGAVLDPLGGIDVGGSAGGWVVFESTVARGVVGRSYRNAVGKVGFAIFVIAEDCVGEDGDGGIFTVGSDDGFDAVGGENFEGGVVGGDVDGVGVFRQENGAGDFLSGAVFANGLGDGEDVGFGERGVFGRAAVAGGAEGDELARVIEIGAAVEIGADEGVTIDEEVGRWGFAGEGGEGHGNSWLMPNAKCRMEMQTKGAVAEDLGGFSFGIWHSALVSKRRSRWRSRERFLIRPWG
jgi:hypothetical protein